MADKEDKKGGFSKEQITMWNRWKQIVNMDASELKRFRGSDDADEVGLDTDQAKRAGVSVQSGHEMSKKIERVIAKAAGHKGFLPPKVWSSDDWEVVGSTINYISRARANKGDLTDDEGNPTPKKLALMLWGRKEKEGSSFPDKDDVKDMVNKKLQETKSMKFGAYLQTLVEAAETKKEWTKKEIDLLFDSDAENGIFCGSEDDISEFSSEIGAVMELLSDNKLDFGVDVVKLNIPASEAEKVVSFYIKFNTTNSESEAFAWDGHKNISFITVLTDRTEELIEGLFKNQKHPVVARYLNSVMPGILADRD